jgi:hypothetical protein
MYNTKTLCLYYIIIVIFIMSIAVMRRKVRENHPRVAPISGHLPGGDGQTGVNDANRGGFSINGGHRNLRGIGNVRMVGSGGWSGGGRGAARGGTGNSSWYFSANDASIVKRSSRGNAAMIDMKYRWIKGAQYPRVWYKDIPSATLEVRSQSEYIKKRAGAVVRCGTVKVTTAANPCSGGGLVSKCTYFVGTGALKKKRVRWLPVTKTVTERVVSQSDYVEKGLLKMGRRNCLSLPEPNKYTHFPMYLHRVGCDVNYLTWQEAVAAGALPANYVGSSS